MTIEERITNSEADAFAELRRDQAFLAGFRHLPKVVPFIGEEKAVRLGRMIMTMRAAQSTILTK